LSTLSALATLATLLAALAARFLLLLTRLLLPAAALLTTLLTTLLLTALAWVLISHDFISPAGKFPQRTTSIPRIRSFPDIQIGELSRKEIEAAIFLSLPTAPPPSRRTSPQRLAAI
jgi:hypothetical protein